METDTGEIKKAVDSWIRELPSDAHAVQARCSRLIGLIEKVRGSYAPDAASLKEIQSTFAGLEQDMPHFKTFFTAMEKTRTSIQELKVDSLANPLVQSGITEWSEEQISLLGHLTRIVNTRGNVFPALNQLDQVRGWVRRWREALKLLRQVSTLRAQADGAADTVMAEVERNWTEHLQRGKLVEETWLDEAQSQLDRLREEFRSSTTSVVRPAEPASFAPAADTAVVSLIPLNDIDVALAECRDLVRALRIDDYEISEFQRRQQALYDHPTEASIQKLLAAVDTYHIGLRESALKAQEKRLQVLRHRWTTFKAIYKERAGSQCKQLVDKAESLKAENTSLLLEFFERVDAALGMIDNTVAGNRPPLTAAIDSAMEASRAQIKGLRAHPRTLAVEEGLKKQEIRLHEQGRATGSVAESFDWLEVCQDVLKQLEELQQEHQRILSELSDSKNQLVKIAEGVLRVGDSAESSKAEAFISKITVQDLSSPWLDARRASLQIEEKELDTLILQVRRRLIGNLVALREENMRWIQVLTDFNPLVTAFESRDPVPTDLDDLFAATDRESESKTQIAIIAEVAVIELQERIRKTSDQLRERIALPSFETHTDRGRAISSLDALGLVPNLLVTCGIDEFLHVYDIFADAEYLLYNLDKARRELPIRVATLRERFQQLNELNAPIYRPVMAHRVRALVMGMERAIQSEQFGSLEFQIEHTQRLIAALEADVKLRVSADTEILEQRMMTSMKKSANPRFITQAEFALAQLQLGDHLETPTNRTRQALERLLARGEGAERING